jgi:protein-tyrosine phosphatase
MSSTAGDLRRPGLGLLLAAATLFAGAAAPAGARPPEVQRAAHAAVIPFTEANVSPDDGHGSPGAWRITWAAPASAGEVVLMARTSAAPDGPEGHGRPVGRGGASGAMTWTAPSVAARWYFELRPRRGAPLTIADRSLHLPSAPNFRDVGGYRTTDGRWVRMGVAYRSDQLDRLSDADLATLAKMAPDVVVDLRTDAERRKGADRLPPGAQALVEDVMADDPPDPGLLASLKTPEASADLLTSLNRRFVASVSARRAYSGLFDALATTPGSVVYHCTAGKDRTGWASAVLLTALGVPRETVIADYLASNVFLTEKNKAMFSALPPDKQAALEPLMTVRRAYLEAAFAEADRRYGGFDRYLKEALGIDEAALARLKARFLEGAPNAA